MPDIVDFILHIDAHLADLLQEHGAWIYLILFLIIFCETGLVVTPFLPGDSLLFAVGALAAADGLSIVALTLMLIAAAIIGDSVNYKIGSMVGTRVFRKDALILKLDYLRRTQAFYNRYGGKVIVIGRFIPIVRTYAPFVAGAAQMSYTTFLTYNVLGGVAWITIFLWAGFLFGRIPAVEDNFIFVVIAIVILSVVPAAYEVAKSRKARRLAAQRRKDSL